MKLSAKRYKTLHHETDKVSMDFDKSSSVHLGYEAIHKECSKLLFDQDRKAILSMKTSGLDHVYSQESLKVILL